jgi:hypothetical protein
MIFGPGNNDLKNVTIDGVNDGSMSVRSKVGIKKPSSAAA